MLRTWQEQGVDKLLKKAWKKGIVLTGISAGAICWFKYGVSDAVKNSKDQTLFGKVKGLNFLENNIIISPHHIREKEIREKSLREILQNANDRTWYRITDGFKKLNGLQELSDCHSWLGQVKQQIEEFIPLKVHHLLCKEK